MSQNEAAAQSGGEEEIDEIMKEIRSLQDSISKAPAETNVPAASQDGAHLHLVPNAESPAASDPQPEEDMADFHGAGGGGGSDGPSLEETMASMKGDPEAKTLFDEEAEKAEAEKAQAESAAAAEEETVSDQEIADVIDQITEEAKASDSEDGSLTMTLTGKMSLNLNYAFGDHSVKLRFQENALVVEMSDGMELKIPLRSKPGSRAA